MRSRNGGAVTDVTDSPEPVWEPARGSSGCAHRRPALLPRLAILTRSAQRDVVRAPRLPARKLLRRVSRRLAIADTRLSQTAVQTRASAPCH